MKKTKTKKVITTKNPKRKPPVKLSPIFKEAYKILDKLEEGDNLNTKERQLSDLYDKLYVLCKQVVNLYEEK